MPGNDPLERGRRIHNDAVQNPDRTPNLAERAANIAHDLGTVRANDWLHDRLFLTMPDQILTAAWRMREPEVQYVTDEVAEHMRAEVVLDIRETNRLNLGVILERNVHNALEEFRGQMITLPLLHAVRERIRTALLGRLARDANRLLPNTTDLIPETERKLVYEAAYRNAMREFDLGGVFANDRLFEDIVVPDHPNDIRAPVFDNRPFLPIADETAFIPPDIRWTIRERALPPVLNTGAIARIALEPTVETDIRHIPVTDQPGLATQGMLCTFEDWIRTQAVENAKVRVAVLVCSSCGTRMYPTVGTAVISNITVEEAPLWECSECNRKVLKIRRIGERDIRWYGDAIREVSKYGTIMDYEKFMRILLQVVALKG